MCVHLLPFFRGTNIFEIRINTAAKSESTFVLTYEELITRELSNYEQKISLKPGNIVNKLSVSVRIIDNQAITFFNGPSFMASDRISNNEVRFTYSPSTKEQNDGTSGLSREVAIKFDVNHPTDHGAGLIIVNDCYFAQFFSPVGISRIPADIVFIIDTSGSMSGTKIDQARESLVEVISQLASEDHFTILTFSNDVHSWKDHLVTTIMNRREGQSFARSLKASGSTNFYDALMKGIRILKKTENSDFVHLLIMLSDGEPTAGIVDHTTIVNAASEEVVGSRISLNMIGFGQNLNLLLLQRLAIRNNGVVKQIFEGKDAAGQLEGFYQSISNPVLHSLQFNYPSDKIDTISKIKFPLFFKGSEVVVAGKFKDSACTSGKTIPVTVSGMGLSDKMTFSSAVDPKAQTVIEGIKPNTERLVAYLTIQQLLRSLKVTS